MKLKESIPSNSAKIIDLYNKIDSEILHTRPDFQRKLVWKKQHKFQFIQTILMNFPFPEIYIASAEMDVEKLTAKEIVVDGQQRLTAIVDYIKGINDFEKQSKITPFGELTTDEKREFLNYLVTVKDLKDMNIDLIKEIFKRINNTEYSLNAVEKTNAQYGDGEFSIFCKQLVDSSYFPTDDITDIVLDQPTKATLNKFFNDNAIFSDNDKSRMFDIQYAMLITSTILEGDYYGRSAKVEEYLKKFNSSFNLYPDALRKLIKSINVISKLNLNEKSYWFNKANLFTLIIELSKVKNEKLNLKKLEHKLLDLETKNDDYFSEINLDKISDNEKKYFEVARQGSNERASRVHRGQVIAEIISLSIDTETITEESVEKKRLKILDDSNINYITISPTSTGLNKSILDATSSVREFLKINDIHDYDKQGNGTENKKILDAYYILKEKKQDTEVSLYKANNRGDARIWFKDLKDYAQADNEIAMILKNKKIFLINISTLPVEEMLDAESPFNQLVIQ